MAFLGGNCPCDYGLENMPVALGLLHLDAWMGLSRVWGLVGAGPWPLGRGGTYTGKPAQLQREGRARRVSQALDDTAMGSEEPRRGQVFPAYPVTSLGQ